MTPPAPPRNLAASISNRLLNLARARKEDAQFALTEYGIERLLYRRSVSPHASVFVLKGASLFTVWSGHPHRATKDIDLLGMGAPDLERLERVFHDVCLAPAEDDGLFFDPSTVATERTKEGANYEGVRVTLRATLGTARLVMQIDVGFGDVVTPAFATDAQKQSQWQAFLNRSRVAETTLALATVVEQLWAFLEAPLRASRGVSVVTLARRAPSRLTAQPSARGTTCTCFFAMVQLLSRGVRAGLGLKLAPRRTLSSCYIETGEETWT